MITINLQEQQPQKISEVKYYKLFLVSYKEQLHLYMKIGRVDYGTNSYLFFEEGGKIMPANRSFVEDHCTFVRYLTPAEQVILTNAEE